MKLTWKHSLVPGATMIAAATLYSSGLAFQHGQGGNSAASVGATPVQSAVPGKALGSGGNHILYAVTGGTGQVYRIDEAAGTSQFIGTTSGSSRSGLSKQPGTRNYFISGGMTDPGNVYIAALPSPILIGNGGLGAMSGLAFDPADSRLYATYTASVLSDGLCEINPATGAATPIGAGMGGPGGIDSLAIDPTSGTMYGSTGFFYDGSPGDVITINKATGLGTDTGQDMSPQPPCTVAGMAFANDGRGYVSIGCGAGTGGDIYHWDTSTNQLTFIVNATGFAESVSDIEVAR